MSLSSGRAERPLWLVLWSQEAGGRTVSRAGREGVGRCGLVVFEREEAPLSRPEETTLENSPSSANRESDKRHNLAPPEPLPTNQQSQ